jgi:hypothetical protein
MGTYLTIHLRGVPYSQGHTPLIIRGPHHMFRGYPVHGDKVGHGDEVSHGDMLAIGTYPHHTFTGGALFTGTYPTKH